MAAVVAAASLMLGILAVAPASAATVVGRVTHSSGRCLENAGGATADNNKIALAASCGTGTNQQWTRWSDGTVRVQGKCLDVRSGATADNSLVVLFSCGTSTSQKWSVLGDGRVVNQKAQRCLQPSNGSATVGNQASIARCGSAATQRWTLPAVSTPTTTPPPATTTPRPPTTTTSTPATALSWDSDFTGAGVSRFSSTPWNNVGASAPVLVTSPTATGQKALQFTIPGGGNRSEVEPAIRTFTEGDDLWFGFSMTLPADFPTQTQSWQLVTQWKNAGTGSPPLEITVGKGNIWLSGGYGHPAGPKSFSTPISAADTGRRVDLVVHVVFSRDPAKGSVDVWRDGTQRITGFRPTGGTLYPTTASNPTASLSSYWKMGLYRDPAIAEPARYVIERARVGSSYAGVTG